MSNKYTDFLGLRYLSSDTIKFLLEQTKPMREVLDRRVRQLPTLRGKTILTLFFEPSTRTRVSFEQAIRMMGATSINIDVANSSIKKGESLYDMIRNLEALGIDAIVVRHPNGGAPKFIADIASVPVINAGDGYHEHPTQGLLDLFTMQEAKGDLKGKKVLIVGDIAHSRVAKSNIWGLSKLGAEVFVAGPPTLMPSGIEKMGATIVTNIDDVIPDMDFINVLRIQYERQDTGYFPSVREYRALYGITEARLASAKKDVVILHPGPINRGVELDSAVADGPNNVILDQVSNGIAVRMMVLFTLLNTENSGSLA